MRLGKFHNVIKNTPPEIKEQVRKQMDALDAKARYQALGRMKAGQMNKTEQKYAERLEALKSAGKVLWWRFEAMNLKLADKCFYRVDFMVLNQNADLEVHEVKGFWTDDALIKIKVAADIFPFRFVAMQLKKGEWEEREF